MSTFYAAFPDPIRAQQLVRHLLNDGIELDDISLVTRGKRALEGFNSSLGDASFYVGRRDDPDHALIEERSNAPFEVATGSRTGGGISTSDRNEDVDSVDQMEDSQSAAEEELWPADETSNSLHELNEFDEIVETGFGSPVTPMGNDVTSNTEPDRGLEAVAVKGLGMVVGGGDLATAAFDWPGKNGELDAAALLTYLQDEGVPPGPANALLEQLGNEGALLAVALGPDVDEGALEEVAERYGAVVSGWYGAPRY